MSSQDDSPPTSPNQSSQENSSPVNLNDVSSDTNQGGTVDDYEEEEQNVELEQSDEGEEDTEEQEEDVEEENEENLEEEIESQQEVEGEETFLELEEEEEESEEEDEDIEEARGESDHEEKMEYFDSSEEGPVEGVIESLNDSVPSSEEERPVHASKLFKDRIESMFEEGEEDEEPEEEQLEFEDIQMPTEREEDMYYESEEEEENQEPEEESEDEYEEILYEEIAEPKLNIESHFSEVIQDTDEYGEEMLQNFSYILTSFLLGYEGDGKYRSSKFFGSQKEELSDENDTWLLVQMLEGDRFRRLQEEEDISNFEKVVPAAFTDKQFILSFIKEGEIVEGERDYQFREALITLQWLENVWKHDVSFQPTSEYYSFSVERKGGELDPDVPFREGRDILMEEDQISEKKLFMAMWKHIRGGEIEEAKDICRRSKHFWRAASIFGGSLHHDRHFDGELIVNSTEGNIYRNLWQFSCLTLSEESTDEYERAIYGSFCGNFGAVLPVCKTWKDRLWTYLKAIVISQINRKLSSCRHEQSDLLYDRIDNSHYQKHLKPYGKNIAEVMDILDEDKVVREQALNFYNMIQKLIICGEIDSLIKFLAEKSNTPNKNRLAAHLVLFYFKDSLRDDMDQNESFKYGKQIMEKYIDYLISLEQTWDVARYCSKLSEDKGAEKYAHYLKHILDKVITEGSSSDAVYKVQRKCYSCAKITRLNWAKIVEKLIRLLHEREMLNARRFPETQLTKQDEKFIQSLRWITLDKSYSLKAIHEANWLIRTFLASSKVRAAFEIFDKDIINASIIRRVQKASEFNEEEVNSVLQEFEDLRILRDSEKLFVEYTEGCTISDDPEKISVLAREVQSKLEMIVNPSERWLQDEEDDEQMLSEEKKYRKKQLESIRKLYIPNRFFLLWKVLFEQQKFKESMKLSEWIADPEFHLVKYFSTENLRDWMEKMKLSALENLKNGEKDPLGEEGERQKNCKNLSRQQKSLF